MIRAREAKGTGQGQQGERTLNYKYGSNRNVRLLVFDEGAFVEV